MATFRLPRATCSHALMSLCTLCRHELNPWWGVPVCLLIGARALSMVFDKTGRYFTAHAIQSHSLFTSRLMFSRGGWEEDKASNLCRVRIFALLPF